MGYTQSWEWKVSTKSDALSEPAMRKACEENGEDADYGEVLVRSHSKFGHCMNLLKCTATEPYEYTITYSPEDLVLPFEGNVLTVILAPGKEHFVLMKPA